MAEISSMLPLNTKAPDFNLLDTCTQKKVSFQNLKSPITVICFICNHCPYVKYILPNLIKLIKHYQAHNISFIAISSNNANTYPEDGPEKMAEVATQEGFTFPYLYDETQAVAKAYHAVCTPDFFIFHHDLCVYRGRFDEASPKNGIKPTGKDLQQALEDLLANRKLNPDQHPSIGCGIKWKSS